MRAVRKVAGPSSDTLGVLASLQGTVSVGAFAQRVLAAKAEWEKKTSSKPKEAAFDEIKKLLTRACWGARRCNYCEDSVADEIEHFRPKDWYPDLAFAWSNYLYACGPCNGPKSNLFPLFATPGSARIQHLVPRKKGATIVPPPSGDPVLIDPRCEDPMDFLYLDIEGNLHFAPRSDLPVGSRDHERALTTIRLLHLNDRDDLVKARATTRAALRVALWSAFIATVNPSSVLAGLTSLEDARTAIRETPHRFVWEELVRHRTIVPAYDTMLTAVPEALSW